MVRNLELLKKEVKDDDDRMYVRDGVCDAVQAAGLSGNSSGGLVKSMADSKKNSRTFKDIQEDDIIDDLSRKKYAKESGAQSRFP